MAAAVWPSSRRHPHREWLSLAATMIHTTMSIGTAIVDTKAATRMIITIGINPQN